MKSNSISLGQGSIFGRVRRVIASLALSLVVIGAISPTQSEAAYYDSNYDNYEYYSSLYYNYGYDYNTYVLGHAYPYYYYYMAGVYADYYSWVDAEGYKQEAYGGSGAYYYDYFASTGDWYWWTY